jgi:hypothetical protein
MRQWFNTFPAMAVTGLCYRLVTSHHGNHQCLLCLQCWRQCFHFGLCGLQHPWVSVIIENSVKLTYASSFGLGEKTEDIIK